MTLDKADTAVAAPSNARSLRNFVGRFLLPMSPVLLSLRNYLLLTPVIFAARFHLRRLYWRLTGHPLKQLVQGAGVGIVFRNRDARRTRSRQYRHHASSREKAYGS